MMTRENGVYDAYRDLHDSLAPPLVPLDVLRLLLAGWLVRERVSRPSGSLLWFQSMLPHGSVLHEVWIRISVH